MTHEYAPHADEVEGGAIAWDDWVDNIHAPVSGVFGAERDGEMALVGSHARIAGIEGREGTRVVEVEGDEKRVAAFQVHRHNLSALRVDCENSLPLRTAETEGDGMGVAAFQVDRDHAPPRVAEAEGERMRAAAF